MSKIHAKVTLFLHIRKKKCNFAAKLYIFMEKAKKNHTTSPWKVILINFLIAAAVAIILLAILLIGLRQYTQHGVEITVPEITELYLEEARIILESEGLHIEVIDSTYSTKVPQGTIVEQTPLAGSKVKHGRTIYVIQNAQMRRPVVLPELRDMSLRQAKATLSSLGLVIDSIAYEPSAYRDIVLDIRMGDSIINAGTRVSEGSPVLLIVGKGQGTEEVTIPTVVGKSLDDARSWLLSHALTVGIVQYDIPPTEENKLQYIVYSQEPASGTVVVEGTSVNLKLSMDIEKTVTADNEQDEEEFF
jgi:beta-lactam-binding protein with PASTA domain